ncbi:MAG: hypothetical protein RLY20_361, partial [Verrucomicrobiota bacterium]
WSRRVRREPSNKFCGRLTQNRIAMKCVFTSSEVAELQVMMARLHKAGLSCELRSVGALDGQGSEPFLAELWVRHDHDYPMACAICKSWVRRDTAAPSLSVDDVAKGSYVPIQLTLQLRPVLHPRSVATSPSHSADSEFWCAVRHARRHNPWNRTHLVHR